MISAQVVLEGALCSFIEELAGVESASASVYTGDPPQDTPYPLIRIEQIIPKHISTIGRQKKARQFYYQVRVVATERETALNLVQAIDEGLLSAQENKSFPLRGGWDCLDIQFGNGIPTISLPDTAGVYYTQAGNEYTFIVQ